MPTKLDKIFNWKSFLAMNAIIILAAEFVGGGELFFKSGLIHLVALTFVALVVARIFLHYYTYDPILEKALHFILAALFVFAVSHIAEYASYRIWNYDDAMFANVINFYLISLAMISFGIEYVFFIHNSKRSFAMLLLPITAVALAVFAVALFFNRGLVSMDLDEGFVGVYAVLLIWLGALGFWELNRIKALMPMTATFVHWMKGSLSLIGLAAAILIAYEPLEKAGLPTIQIIYSSHFLFYLGMSAAFMAFSHFSHLGGILGEAEKFKNLQ